ncbi:hypothetical protein P4T48_26540 [Bacillus paramycoides]|uniref:hypothetical protein n=1 Tax=Bacillus paramycoides TaxID=2026194 RepID=UPI002E1E2E5D|nr:hypothetical protein [Bacillus paramycoides]
MDSSFLKLNRKDLDMSEHSSKCYVRKYRCDTSLPELFPCPFLHQSRIINLRINTIFHLLENDITDGVIPLQRTLFELQVAFNAFTSAEDKVKKRYVKFFNKKNNFETTNKLKK